jgi:hypothetical protein
MDTEHTHDGEYPGSVGRDVADGPNIGRCPIDGITDEGVIEV